MAETPNHGYNVPEAGTQDWQEPLNENFEAFEADIEIRDTGAPDTNGYTPADGAKYLDTDTGTIYLGDGSSWTEAFSFGGGGGGGGIESLTGGDGINPSDIGDGDTLSVVWGDADALRSAGALATGAVGSDAIQSGAVGSDALATDSVGSDALATGAVGSDVLAAQVAVDELDVGTLTGPLTGGATLSDIAGDNLSIDNGTLNASGSGGSTNLSGGEGIDPGSITDGDTLAVAWGDGAGLDSTGSPDDFGNASDLASGGSVDQLSGSLTSQTLTDIEGDNLSIDNGTLNASGSGGSTSLSGGEGIDPGSITDGDTLSAAWEDAGALDGAGDVAAGAIGATELAQAGASDGHVFRWNGSNSAWETGVPGTTTATPLELQVDGSRALKLGVPANDGANTAGGNVVAGHPNNTVNNSAVGVVIGGGGASNGNENTVGGFYATVAGGFQNTASDFGATVGGGQENTASGSYATVGGGDGNTASGNDATVGGGLENTVSGNYATVGGGRNNEASGSYTTVGGGDDNTASGLDATVSGGFDNTASGTASTVPGGRRGAAKDGYSFVWNDATAYHAIPNSALDGLSSDTPVDGEPVTGAYTFSVSATSGFRFITGSSSVTYIDSGGTLTLANGLDAGSSKLTGVQDPTDAQDAATKSYVDTAGGSPGGSDGYVQFNSSGSFGGSGDLYWDDASGRLGIGTASPAGALDIAGGVLTASGGDLTLRGSSGNGVTINTDGGSRTLELGVPTSDGFVEAGGNIVAGHPNNTVNNNAVGVVIGGGGAADGFDNTVGGSYSTVGGGFGNTASDFYATVGGGRSNTVSGQDATVGGGSGNTASESRATVGGGFENTASGADATVGGGSGNTASDFNATVGGGDGNTASGFSATVGGGDGNTASGDYTTVGGGRSNMASDFYATVGGGQENTASGSNATVGGGNSNTASGSNATVGGGDGNTASGPRATVGGGDGNTASGDQATVGGGDGNRASAFDATVGGGDKNTASGFASTVPGGRRGAAKSSRSFVWNDATEYHAIPNSDIDGLSSDTAVDGEPVTGSGTFSVSATSGFRFITGSSSVTYIDSGGTLTLANGLDAGSSKLTGVQDPTDAQDAATKSYVDTAGGSPGGSDGQIQFNDSGSFGGSGDLYWDDANGRLGIGTGSPAGALDIAGGVLTDSSGDLTLQGSSGNGVTINTDGGSRTLELGVPDSDTFREAGGNVVAGHPNNTVNSGAVGVVIGGGGAADGNENTVGGNYATVGGGFQNTASGPRTTVGGGRKNTASSFNATVGGGIDNTASDDNATVGGGFVNTASGTGSTVPGGQTGAAKDNYSFVWNDATEYHNIPNSDIDGLSSDTDVDGEPVTGSDTFSVSATGGFRFITGPSSVTYIDSGGTLTLANGLDAGSSKLTGVQDPTDAQDAATKSYVDTAGSSPGGSDGQIQFNDSGSFGGSGDLYWDDANGRLGIGTGSPAGALDIAGGVLTASGGDLTLQGSSGNGVTINTDGGSRTLELGVPGTDSAGQTAGGNVVAGHPNNTVKNSAVGVVIGGGGAENGKENTVGGSYAAVGGGSRNTASGGNATVGGGRFNMASDFYATVGGGFQNTASGQAATVGGGRNNTASGSRATVGGGFGNAASSQRATVGGGDKNEASGQAATVPGGRRGAAESSTSFVWNDATEYHAISSSTDGLSSDTPVDGEPVTGSDTFSVSATSGFRFITGGASTPHVTYIDSDGTLSVGGATVQSQSGDALSFNTDGGSRALKLGVPDSDDFDRTAGGNVVAGHPNNTVNNGAVGVVIGGGGAADGNENTVGGNYATVGGGVQNAASGNDATVGGGDGNTASGYYATVGGGGSNTASGNRSTVPGGRYGAAESSSSFVWNDGTSYHAIPNSDIDGLSSDTDVDGEPVTGSDTFSVSATSGFRFITGSALNPKVTYIPGDSAGWTTTSSRAVKTNIDPVDPQDALAGVDSMEVATWEYESEDGDGADTTHIGPMAEDFHDAFDVGSSDEHINSINADGVALAAIQGLSAELDERDGRIDDLETTVEDQRAELAERDGRIDDIEAENEQLRERNAELEQRLAAVEEQLGLDAGATGQGVADD